jgi:hypothetical protein
MSGDHSLGSASLLQGGKVLVSGGSDTSTNLATATADLYDPETDSFSAVTLGTRRAVHTATVLPNGKVLLAGGESQFNPPATYLQSAELFW